MEPRLAPRAQVGLSVAAGRARSLGRDRPSSVDLVHALVSERDPIVAALEASGVDLVALLARGTALAEVEPGPDPMAAAALEAVRRGQALVGPEQVMLGILSQPRDPVASALVEQLGDLRPLRGQLWRATLDARPGGDWEPAGPGTAWSQVVDRISPLRATQSTLPAQRRAAVERVLDRVLLEEPIVGLALTLLDDGRLVHTSCRGFADLEKARAFDSSTVFRAGSVTKLFTAVAVLQLRDDGLVDLEQPAARYLRSLTLSDPSVTVLDLLVHTSGLPIGPGLRYYRHPLPSVAEEYQRDADAAERRGRWRYSNYGYAALGLLVEDVTGEPLSAYLAQRILEPLGMIASRCDEFLPTSARAIGYAIDHGEIVPVRDSAVVTGGSGFLWSTVSDLTRFASALLDGGRGEHGSILKSETLATMVRPFVTTSMPRLAQGLGFLLWSVQGSPRGGPTLHTLAGHTGDVPGHHCVLLADLARARGAVIATNTDTGILTSLAIDLLTS